MRILRVSALFSLIGLGKLASENLGPHSIREYYFLFYFHIEKISTIRIDIYLRNLNRTALFVNAIDIAGDKTN